MAVLGARSPPLRRCGMGREVKVSEALEALQITGELTEAGARAAFAARVKEAHPDSGADAAGAASRIAALRKARDVLAQHMKTLDKACSMCQGSGVVRTTSWRKVLCPRCGGKSEG